MKPFLLSIQSFGRANEYRRAALTVLSLFAVVSNPEEWEVAVFTDQPDWFSDIFSDLPVNYILLSPEKIREMRGKIDFLHRMKIALIEEGFSRFPEQKIFYADSDTFFTADPTPLMNRVDPNTASMHLREYSFDTLRDMKLPAGKTFQAFYKLITNQQFVLSDGTPFTVRPEMFSWNAGVMIFHPEHRSVIPDVYCLTDQFYPPTENHASEQYAFSVLLQTRFQLIPCESVNYHYWYRIKKQIVDHLTEQYFDERFHRLSLRDRLEFVRSWTGQLPQVLEEHIWMSRDRAIQALNEDQYKQGYRLAIKALIQQPGGSKAFLKDVLYHVKRQIRA
jgi:hypothetical protein